jgi:hypothetical protein
MNRNRDSRTILGCKKNRQAVIRDRPGFNRTGGLSPVPSSHSMTSTSTLTGALLRTYDTIFQNPLAHDLAWRDVHTLFRHLGHVEQEPNGNLTVTRHGESLVLPPPLTKEVAATEELMALRQFLQRSEAARPVAADAAAHWLLVIDHHEARLFRSEMHGAVPQKLLPHEPDRYFRHEQNSQNLSRGKEKPDPNSFFAPIAQALRTVGQLLIFGTGKGHSSEMDQFVAWLKTHHPELAGRIIGSLTVDENHLTDGQLLAKAREFYENRARSQP